MKKLFSKFKNVANACWYGACIDWGGSITTADSAMERVVGYINLAISLSALVAVGLIIYGGITLITAAGDPEKVEKGGKVVTAAIIGMIVIFLVKLIFEFVIRELLK